MPRMITVELPDEVYEPLLRMSMQLRHTPQEVVAELVAYAIRQLEAQGGRPSDPADPAARFLGDGVTHRTRF